MVASFLDLKPGLGLGSHFHPGLTREIGLIAIIFALSASQGALLAARFRVLALLPFVGVNAMIIGLAWAASGSHDVARVVTQVLVSGIAIQFGYLADQVGSKAQRLR